MKRLRPGVTTKIWVLLAIGLSLAKLDGMLAADWFLTASVPLGMAVVTTLMATYVNTDGDHDAER